MLDSSLTLVGIHAGAGEGEHALLVERLLLLVAHIGGMAMRMTSWFESVRRQFGSVTGAKSRQHGSGATRWLTPAFVESLEAVVAANLQRATRHRWSVF